MSGREVEIDYTNWQGERRVRRIQPMGDMRLGGVFHEGWIIFALDLEKNALREFALSGIHSWKEIA